MFMPYIVMQLPETIVDEDDDGVADEKQAWVEAYAGIDMKYTTAAGPVVVGTIYPDFRNVENEILGLDFSYTEQWRDDNRPFFAEGKRYFPDSWIFYTNRIEEMYTGGKMFGQLGNHRIGLIDAYDRNKVNHLAGAWYWQPITRLEMEHNVTWWHGPKDAPRRDEAPLATDNVVVVSEIRKSRLSGNSTEYYVMQGGFSRTASDTGSGIGDGTHFEARFDRFGGNGSIGANLKFRYFSPGFMAFDGLTDMQESDQRDASIHLEYDRQFDRYWFRELEIEGFARYAERVDGDIAAKIGSGVLYTRIAKVGGWISIIPGAGIGTEYREEERPPYHDRKGEVMLWWNDNTLYSGGDVGVRFGRVEGGDYLLVSASQGARALGALSTALRTQYQRREFPFGYDDDRPLGGIEHSVQVIGTLQYDISPERAISGRLSYIDSDQKWPLTYGDVGDHLNGYATFRQVVRSGLDLFLIVGDPSADTWTKRVALKAMFVI